MNDAYGVLLIVIMKAEIPYLDLARHVPGSRTLPQHTLSTEYSIHDDEDEDDDDSDVYLRCEK